jgi:hypothetical protein
MKIRWLIDQPGMTHGVCGQKRGDVQDVPEADANRYINVAQIATAQLKGPLPQPYTLTEEALRDEVLKAVAAQCHNPAFDPRPGSEPIFTPRQRVRNEGWVA